MYKINIIFVCSRRPAWTDRILYKKIEDDKFQLNVLSYNYINSITLSDHKPVYGESCIQVLRVFTLLLVTN